MKIPTSPDDRQDLYESVIRDCLTSREERCTDYELNRAFFLFGTPPGNEPATYNKIFPSIDLLSAFLFASETTRFSIELGPSVSKVHLPKVPKMNECIADDWQRSNADMIFGMALVWALVYNTSIIKLMWRNGSMHPYYVNPDSFGVLRENTSGLDRQEAMVHTYLVSKAELERQLAAHPKREDILSNVSAQITQDSSPAVVDRMILTAVSPTIQGTINPLLATVSQYRPRVDDKSVQMEELWIWDDDMEDYRVVTRADNCVTVYDRRNFWVPHEHPFIQICPDPLPEYFWGMSQVQRLIPLQVAREKRMDQIADLLDRQVKPPTSLTGWLGMLDEKDFALNKVGGVLQSSEITAKVERHKPDIPQDLFNEIRELDHMFAEETGLQNVLSGKGEAGVRSGRQTTELARLGSARIKKRSLVVEDALEKMATLYARARQHFSKTIYEDDNGVKFAAHQFPDDFLAKVDAHSNSPIFVEDHKQLAGEMLEAHVIDRETFVDLVSPPMKPILKQRLKKIEEGEAKAAQAAQQAEAAKAAPKGNVTPMKGAA